MEIVRVVGYSERVPELMDVGDDIELEIDDDERLPGWHLTCGSTRWDSLDMQRPRRWFCRETLVLTNMLAVCSTLEDAEGGGRQSVDVA